MNVYKMQAKTRSKATFDAIILEGAIRIMSEDSTIRISKKMKKELEELGTLADTYESVIGRLVEFYKKHSKNGDKK
jgi:hypothetical protein